MSQIETSSQVLREIAERVREYGFSQMDIVSEYLYRMNSLKECIELNEYEEILYALETLKKDMESVYHQALFPFVTFLHQKADYLDRFILNTMNFSGNMTVTTFSEKGVVDMSVEYLHSPVDYLAHVSKPIDYSSEREFDPTTYKNSEYKTYVVESPVKVYRYFGSFDSPGVDMTNESLHDDWGSDAAGAWASPIRTNNPERVRKLLATEQEWGNDATFVAEIQIPKGTVISVGKAAAQGKLPGGGEQIYIHKRNYSQGEKPEMAELSYKKEIRSWITRCGPIETFDFNL